MSIKKVAEISGVSIATVSRYFSKPNLLKQETLEKVKAAVDSINYQPNTLAQNFRRGRSGRIVVVVYNIGNPIYENFTHVITRIAQSKGYDVLIKEAIQTPLGIKYYQDMLRSKQADGLIVMTDLPQTDDESKAVLKNLPIVFIESSCENNLEPNQYIGLANFQAASNAINHLLELGHRSIACISPTTMNTAYKQRIKGYTDTMEKAGLNHKHVFYTSQSTCHLSTLVEQLININPYITAIFCIDDDIAIDILPLIKLHGIQVPENMSIIGFNNIRYASKTTPPLTTVELPLLDIASHAIQLLCQKMTHPLNTSNAHIEAGSFNPQHQLILRSSTAEPATP